MIDGFRFAGLLAFLIKDGLLYCLDSGGPTARTANVFGADHHVGQHFVERVAQRLEVFNLADAFVEYPVGFNNRTTGTTPSGLAIDSTTRNPLVVAPV